MKKDEIFTLDEEDLFLAQAHLGHKSSRIHPRSKKYIYKFEKGFSIINLEKTISLLKEAVNFAYKLGKEKKTLLIIGTKPSIRNVVKELAEKYNLPYINNKWQGGFLTNFEEFLKNIQKMKNLQKELAEGKWETFPKHEQIKMKKALKRLENLYQSVNSLEKIPDALFIIDINKEKKAVKEAMIKQISMIAITDTNSNPDLVDYPIPANDDAQSSVSLISETILAAYQKGLQEEKIKN